MKRREFISLLGGTATAWPFRAGAAGGKIAARRCAGVGVAPASIRGYVPTRSAHPRLFGRKGYPVDFHYTGGRSDHAGEIATGFVGSGVDVIVAHFTPAVRAAMGATQTIPIVMAPAGAPLQSGFIDSLARPGGNVTGLSAMEAELGGRRVQILRDLIPNLALVAVLASTTVVDPFSGPFVENLRSAATRSGIQLEPLLVSSVNELESAFASMTKANAQAVIIQPLFDPHRAMLVELATKHQLALMSSSRETAMAGGVVSFSADYIALYERAASYVDKIIEGAKRANLPVEQPTKFQVMINVKTAQALGLTISPTLLAQADEVIE